MVAPLVIGGRTGECIDAVVLGVAAMALDPAPVDSVRGRSLDQLLPQLGILDRLLIGGPPAVSLPVVDPSGDSVADVDAVGMQPDPARALQRFQPPDRGEQLHSVVG